MAVVPILYSFRRCPYAMRARLALVSAGMDVELREVLLRDKAPEFLAASPSGTVPCLDLLNANVIDESLDIMLWALGQADPEGWLKPDEGTLDEMLLLIEMLDGDFKMHLDRYKYDTRYPDASLEEERAAAAAILSDLEKRLQDRPWLFGRSASLADYAFLPFLRQFANVDRGWFEAADWPRLKAWLRAFEDSARFAAIMPKYQTWNAGDPPLIFSAAASAKITKA
ncbi:glutathione S-transferase [Labrenzia sp. CE80]|uniref:glutathione S-transferase n=1 Tax=Labrenzia sp. CE80 TaxID=1788986 RepID=UPI00129B86EE|nr:glutathione S-transferase [Labrenzia sp. CE80]